MALKPQIPKKHRLKQKTKSLPVKIGVMISLFTIFTILTLAVWLEPITYKYSLKLNITEMWMSGITDIKVWVYNSTSNDYDLTEVVPVFSDNKTFLTTNQSYQSETKIRLTAFHYIEPFKTWMMAKYLFEVPKYTYPFSKLQIIFNICNDWEYPRQYHNITDWKKWDEVSP